MIDPASFRLGPTILERLFLRLPILKHWGARWRHLRLLREEDVVSNVGQAKWVVMQADGSFRYVRSRLYARDCDHAMDKDVFVAACYARERSKYHRSRGRYAH